MTAALVRIGLTHASPPLRAAVATLLHAALLSCAMMAQTHAALWWRQCIPACLHLLATRILAAAGTSLETQIKLTNVARATLDELLEDYLDCLKSHDSAEWQIESEKKTAAREFAKAHAEWDEWKQLFESRPAETLCNLMIVLIQQCRYLLDRMLKWQEEDFTKNGGVRERMHAART